MSDKKNEAINELKLHLIAPKMIEKNGNTHITATVKLQLVSADATLEQIITSDPYAFECSEPSQNIDLDWYFNRYPLWPLGGFKTKSQDIEEELFQWGKHLYETIFPDATHALCRQWLTSTTRRRLSIVVEKTEDPEASRRLIGLPWELLNDGDNCLFMNDQTDYIRRYTDDAHVAQPPLSKPPMNVLIVSPRPKELESLDHRSTANPVVYAAEFFDGEVIPTVLYPATFTELKSTLAKAEANNCPYHAIHFDGKIVLNENNTPGLYFEKIADDPLAPQTDIVDIDQLTELTQQYKIPLCFLTAQQVDQKSISNVIHSAESLLDKGVTSVVIMKHWLQIERAQAFYSSFFLSLIHGESISDAMRKGKNALVDTNNDQFLEEAVLLSEWFLPILMQKQGDYSLFHPSECELDIYRYEMMDLLPALDSHFLGRSRELLMYQRILDQYQWLVIQGIAAEGKSTLAVEFLRWMIRTSRIDRAVYISVTYASEVSEIIEEIGNQLIGKFSIPENETDILGEVMDPLLAIFEKDRTWIVIDDIDEVLPWENNLMLIDPQVLDDILTICHKLSQFPNTRIIFTTQKELPDPFNNAFKTHLSGMEPNAAIRLVFDHFKSKGLNLKKAPGSRKPNLEDMVQSVKCHAGALTFMAHGIAQRGVNIVTKRIQKTMRQLEKTYKDERERALCINIDLGLQQLPKTVQARIDDFSVFTRGANIILLSVISGDIALIMKQAALRIFETCGSVEDTAEAMRHIEDNPDLKEQVINDMVGTAESLYNEFQESLTNSKLANFTSLGHIELYPGMIKYILLQTTPESFKQVQDDWKGGMRTMIDMMFRQLQDGVHEIEEMVLLELPNIMAYLQFLKDMDDVENFTYVAPKIEFLAACLKRYQMRDHIAAMRKKVENK